MANSKYVHKIVTKPLFHILAGLCLKSLDLICQIYNSNEYRISKHTDFYILIEFYFFIYNVHINLNTFSLNENCIQL